MDIQIRKFRAADARKVSNLIKKAFLSIISKEYSQENIEEQIKENSPKKLIEKAKKINYFVAIGKAKIIGFGGYDKEKVHTFFVKPEFQSKGIGSKIMEKVLKAAKKDGIVFLKCWATFNAVKFYSSCGFKTGEKLTLQTKNSPITFLVMTRKL